MKKIALTLLVMCLLGTTIAQTSKCGIDTKALVREEVANGATTIGFLAKMQPGFDRGALEKAGIVIGAQAGQIVTLTVPVESLSILETSKEVLLYSISHRIANPDCDLMRTDTRTDSVQRGLGVDDGMAFDGTGVYIGITDWGFDYTHPNFYAEDGSNYRIAMAWDHFRLAGPSPAALGYGAGLNYGKVISGRESLMAHHGDTSNIYGYGTHGTHVAGISAGGGHNGVNKGQAPGARLLLCSFGLGEKEWMEAVAWMRQVAADSARRLVVNSSWGMYTFSTLDGTSLLSEAINNWSAEGTVFCTSGGNNGRTSIPFHISGSFHPDAVDTVRTVVVRASQIYSISETGQALVLWGDEDIDFSAGLRFRNGTEVCEGPMFSTADGDTVIYDTVTCGYISVPYRIMIEHSNPFDNRPHIQIDVNKTSLETRLYFTADSGTVHAWNIANKENHAGNEGCTFKSNSYDGFMDGDAKYGVGEPACAAKCISVAAHSADKWNSNGTQYFTGVLTPFSSCGPLINGVNKPEISAPGNDVISSISHWTDDNYQSYMSTTHDGTMYIWSKMSGTSMSCPATTGVVALILQAAPRLSVDNLRNIIFSTARNDDKTGPLVARDSMDTRWGWGKIDALKAVNAAIRHVSLREAEDLRLPLHVYPNPVSGLVHVNTGCGEPVTLEVFNTTGCRLMSMKAETEATIDMSAFPKGIYIIKAGSRTQKLIVQ